MVRTPFLGIFFFTFFFWLASYQELLISTSFG